MSFLYVSLMVNHPVEMINVDSIPNFMIIGAILVVTASPLPPWRGGLVVVVKDSTQLQENGHKLLISQWKLNPIADLESVNRGL